METKNSILLAFCSISQNRDESIKVTKVGVKTQKIKLLICLQIKQRKCRGLAGTHHLQTKTNKKNVKMSTGCGGWIQTKATAEHDKVKSNRRKTRLWENPRSLFNEADDSMSIMMRSKHFKVQLPFVWVQQALDVFPNFTTQLPKRSHCRDLNYLPTNYKSQVSQIPPWTPPCQSAEHSWKQRVM